MSAAQNYDIMTIMKKKLQPPLTNALQNEDGIASPFDRNDSDAEDLWFMPDLNAGQDDFQFAPLPRSDQRLLFDPAEWGKAQGDLSAELAALTLRFGALDERLGHAGAGVHQLLAIREAAEISWWAGTRLGADRLALWVGQHTGGGLDDSLSLAQAGWAVRRLMSGQMPDAGGWSAGLGVFLGFTHSDTSPTMRAIEELSEVMLAAQYLHPVTQAAMLFHAWRVAGQGPARDTEAAVMAACHAAGMGRGKALFLPLALGGLTALRGAGSAHARLAGWISGAEQATLAALVQLDRLTVWQKAARKTLSDLSGRTPDLLVDLLSAWPIVSAVLAEKQTGASRAAVQRNLEVMEKRGLIREITGQGRYRVWTAKI